MARLMDGSTLHEITAVPKALLRHRPAERHQQTEVVVTRRGRLAHRLTRRHSRQPQLMRPTRSMKRSAEPGDRGHKSRCPYAWPEAWPASGHPAPPEWAPAPPREGVP